MRFAFRVAVAVVGMTVVLLGYFQHRIWNPLQIGADDQGQPPLQLRLPSGPGGSGQCEEKRHFAFLKVPKAGSSTVQNIFFRFGTLRWLTFVLPVWANYIGRSNVISKRAIIPPPNGKHYDILCNHVMYSRKEFSRVLPEDAAYVGIIREPLPQLESYIYYYHYFDIPGDDKLTEYLDDPYRYILTKHIPPNPQTQYYGLNDRDRTNPAAIKQFIGRMQEEFDLVIVLERLDESLLLLKRRFCWQLTDILYIRKNTNRYNPRRARSHPQRTKHKGLALAEYRFYEHFQMELLRQVVQEGIDFQNELDFYKNTLTSVKSFCLDERRRWGDKFYIPASKWNAETNVSAVVCHVMLLPELELLDLVGKRQYGDQQWPELHPKLPARKRNKGKVMESSVNITLPNGQQAKRVAFDFKNQHNFESRLGEWGPKS